MLAPVAPAALEQPVQAIEPQQLNASQARQPRQEPMGTEEE